MKVLYIYIYIYCILQLNVYHKYTLQILIKVENDLDNYKFSILVKDQKEQICWRWNTLFINHKLRWVLQNIKYRLNIYIIKQQKALQTVRMYDKWLKSSTCIAIIIPLEFVQMSNSLIEVYT